MDINLPGDYVIQAPGEDSDRESHHSSISMPAPVAEAAEEVHFSSEEVIFTDSNPLEDGSDRDEDGEMPLSEKEEEDLMEDLS